MTQARSVLIPPSSRSHFYPLPRLHRTPLCVTDGESVNPLGSRVYIYRLRLRFPMHRAHACVCVCMCVSTRMCPDFCGLLCFECTSLFLCMARFRFDSRSFIQIRTPLPFLRLYLCLAFASPSLPHSTRTLATSMMAATAAVAATATWADFYLAPNT